MEGVVKYTRLNFFVPVPEVCNLEEINAILVEQCRDDMKRRLRGGTGTKAEFLVEDQSSFIPLPPAPFDACRKRSTRASSLSLVRFDDNDYSVPVAYAHHDILAKGYIDSVVLCHKTTVVAEHPRSWGKQGIFFNYIHYLPLLERKPGSLDHARPMAELHLPECFDTLRRRLVAEEATEGEGIRGVYQGTPASGRLFNGPAQACGGKRGRYTSPQQRCHCPVPYSTAINRTCNV